MSYKGDPRRITALFNSTCSKCKNRIKKSSRAYYWPNTKTVMCETCGLPEYNQFLSMAADEEVYHNTDNPY
ncbi:MAG: hypothetical protein HQ522_06435 [Bacteroidetes bacterium]|nr:hypothetical protein [Bacteroidota bacterium]